MPKKTDEQTPVVEEKVTAEVVEETSDDFQVDDPQVLRPKDLPLVVKPAKGKEWKNEAQAEYARILNGYAYSNSDKWSKKKESLLKRLKEIGDTPEAISKYRGQVANVAFKNELLQS